MIHSSSYHRLSVFSKSSFSIKDAAKYIFDTYVVGKNKARNTLGPEIEKIAKQYGLNSTAISRELGKLQDKHEIELKINEKKKEDFESSRRLVEERKEREIQEELDHKMWTNDIKEYEDDAKEIEDDLYYDEYTEEPDEDE